MKPHVTMATWRKSQNSRKPSRGSGGRGKVFAFNAPKTGWRGQELTADMQQNGPVYAHRKQSHGG